MFEDLLDMIDREVSLWRPNSRINQINAWDRTDSLFGFVDSTQIIGPLWALSEELHGLTKGAFDPTVSPLVELWGFGLSEMGNVGASEVDSVMAFIGMVPDRFDMNEEEEAGYYKSTWVRKGDARAALDFNAIAQGYSVDLAHGGSQGAGHSKCHGRAWGRGGVSGNQRIRRPLEDRSGPSDRGQYRARQNV